MSIRIPLAIAACLVASGLMAGTSRAAPMPASKTAIAADSGLAVEQAAVVKKKTVVTKNGRVKTKTVVYSSKRYGPRYRYKRPGYGYYYGGYYYRTPWWRVPGAVIIVNP